MQGDFFARQLFSEGLAYEALEEYSSALDRYRKVTNRSLEESSWGRRAHLRMARINRNHLKDNEQAISHYKSFLADAEGETTITSVSLELARLYRNQERYDKAVETYRNIIESSSSAKNREEGYYYLGEVYLDSAQYKESEETYQTFLEQFSNGDLADGALFNLARAYDAQGEHDKQIETFKRLLQNFPDSGLREYSYLKAIQAFVNQNNPDQAVKWAAGYRYNFNDGKYWDQISTQLKKILERSPETIQEESLFSGTEGGG